MDQETNTQSETQADQNQSAQVTVPQSTDTISEHKLYAILGYVLPFLFFLPMVQDSSKNNAFARYHANQQLNLLGVCIALYVVGRVLLSISYILFTIMPLLNLAVLVLAIMGIIHATQGQMKELPVIGKFNYLDKLFAR